MLEPHEHVVVSDTTQQWGHTINSNSPEQHFT